MQMIEEPITHELHMRNPPIWKDWVGLAGMVTTVAVVLIQGGRILESQDSMRRDLTSIVSVVSTLKEEASAMRTNMAKQEGVDALHAEQLRHLNEKIVALSIKFGR